MHATSDQQFMADTLRKLSASPEPGAHFGSSLVIATLVASPVLLAAAMGRQDIPTALALYLVAIVVVWIIAGLLGGALALFSRAHQPSAETSDPPSPPAAEESVGSDGAY